MNTFQVHLLAADSVFYEGDCESLIVPTADGYAGIMAYHSNMIAAILPGIMTYKLPDTPAQQAAVSSGLVKIEDNKVLILVDSIERPEDIDENRARHAADEAKEAMLQKRSIREYNIAQLRLAREINRLKLKGRNINHL